MPRNNAFRSKVLHVRFRLATSLILLLALLSPLSAQEDSDSVLTRAPGQVSAIKSRLGGFDAVSGVARFSFPLGPKLPGRIPVGFALYTDGSYLNASIRPVSWRIGNASQKGASSYSNSVSLFGQELNFSIPSTASQGPTAAQVQGWMDTFKVVDTGEADVDADLATIMVPTGSTVTQIIKYSNQVIQTSSDGTKVLVFNTWTYGKYWTMNPLNPNSSPASPLGARAAAGPPPGGDQSGTTTRTLTHLVVFTGEMAFSIGQTQSSITNRWGDHVTLTETVQDAFNSTFVLQNANCPSHKITMTVSVRDAINKLDPNVLYAASVNVTPAVPGANVSATGVYCAPDLDNRKWDGPKTWAGGFMPGRIVESPANVGGTSPSGEASRTTLLTWDDQEDLRDGTGAFPSIGCLVSGKVYWPVNGSPSVNGGGGHQYRNASLARQYGMPDTDPDGHPCLYPLALLNVQHPDGTTERFQAAINFDPVWSPGHDGGNGAVWAPFCWKKDTGQWQGLTKSASLLNVAPCMIYSGVLTTLASGIRKSVVVDRHFPRMCWNGTDGTFDKFLPGSRTTTIYTFGSYPGGPADITANPCQVIKLTHAPIPSDLTSSVTDQAAFLGLTSAVVQEEHLFSQAGASVSTTQPVTYTLPPSVVTSQVIQYSGWDLRSWANPKGELTLPMTAFPTRRTIFTKDLPQKMALVGDLANGGYDAFGPVRTDEMTTSDVVGLPSSLWTGLENPAWNTSTSNPSLGEGSAQSVIRTGVITRTMDWNTLTLETNTDEKSLHGGAVKALRNVSSVSFGKMENTFVSGLLKNSRAVNDEFTAEDSLGDYVGPQYKTLTKSLQEGSTLLPGSGRLGVNRTFDNSSYQWLASETNTLTGLTTSYTPDEFGRPSVIVDEHQVETDTAYDGWGRVYTVTRKTSPGAETLTTTTTYDPNGTWVSTLVQGSGQSVTTRTLKDGLGREVRVDHSYGGGAKSDYQETAFDAFGRKWSETPLGFMEMLWAV
jgi:hypothetical protein